MGVLEKYFTDDWKAMQNANNGLLPKPDDSPEGKKQREDFTTSMNDLRNSFGVLSDDEKKRCQPFMDGAEARAKAVDDMHQNWEKAHAPGAAVPPGGIIAQGRNASDNATDADKIIAIQQANWNKNQP